MVSLAETKKKRDSRNAKDRYAARKAGHAYSYSFMVALLACLACSRTESRGDEQSDKG